MKDLTPDELRILACALDRQREHMFCSGDEWTSADYYATGCLIGRVEDELDRREARCACLHPRSVHGTSYCDECPCGGWVAK